MSEKQILLVQFDKARGQIVGPAESIALQPNSIEALYEWFAQSPNAWLRNSTGQRMTTFAYHAVPVQKSVVFRSDAELDLSITMPFEQSLLNNWDYYWSQAKPFNPQRAVSTNGHLPVQRSVSVSAGAQNPNKNLLTF